MHCKLPGELISAKLVYIYSLVQTAPTRISFHATMETVPSGKQLTSKNVISHFCAGQSEFDLCNLTFSLNKRFKSSKCHTLLEFREVTSLCLNKPSPQMKTRDTGDPGQHLFMVVHHGCQVWLQTSVGRAGAP